MNDIMFFLNTRVEGSGKLASIGDACLTPFRYLFRGRTVQIIEPSMGASEPTIHHVASFHEKGDRNCAKTDARLRSSSLGTIQTLLAVVFIIPGLVLSVFKLLAYLFSDVRQRHNLAKDYLTPQNLEIGSAEKPIATFKELQEVLAQAKKDLKRAFVNALIIHGNGELTINEDPGILGFNPMKLILERAKFVHEPSLWSRLDDSMYDTGKWEGQPFQGKSGTLTINRAVSSTEEALAFKAPTRDLDSHKQYHTVFTIQQKA